MDDLRQTAIAAYGGKEPGRMKAEITLAIGIKRCSRCRSWKRIGEFGASRGRADGLNNKCLVCTSEYRETWRGRPENADKQATYTRRCRYGSDEAQARNAENRLRARCSAYGITPDDYRALLAQQDGGCAICGRTPEQNGKALAIDHDHRCCPQRMRSCGKCVRGLLCSPCNVAVGYFESEDMMRACQQYVGRKGKNPAGPG